MAAVNGGKWLHGLSAAFIGGGASAVSAGFAAIGIDPSHFNFGGGLFHTLQLMGATFLVAGIMSAAHYLAKSPVPEIWDGADRRGAANGKSNS